LTTGWQPKNMVQDSIVPRRIEDPWETKEQDDTWIHMLGSLSDHA